MSEGYTGWFDGWQNARQRRAIEGLEGHIGALSSSLSRQRQEAARLRSQLSQLHGTLEQRVNQLTRSLEALVELSDVRQILAMYDDPALVRHWARETITDLSSAEKDFRDRPAPPDLPGYWLGPAVAALLALSRDQDPTESIALAQERDRDRTALLLASGLAVVGRPELAEPWLAGALGQLTPGVPVTVAQRALWTEMAAGGFGAAGTEVLRHRLTELTEALTPAQAAEERRAWTELVIGLPVGTVRIPAVARHDTTLRRGLEAGARMAALRALCISTAVTSSSGGEPGRPALTEVVHGLVDEGTTEEAPLLRRAAELRAAIGGGPESAPPGWDGEAGDPCALLRADARDAGHPERARIATHVGRRWLRDEATRLAEAATGTRLPGVTVSAAGDEIRVGPSGPDTWDLARVRTLIQKRPVIDRRAGKITMWLAIAGGVLCVPVIGWPNGWAVLSVLIGIGLLVTGVVRWQRERAARVERAQHKDAELARTEQQVTQTASQLADLQRQLSEAADRASADLTAIQSRLPG